MKKTCILLALLQAAATFFPLYTNAESADHHDPSAEAAAPADTSAGVWNENLSGSVVTGTRDATDVRHLPMTVTTVGRQEIEQSHNTSLLPLLTEGVPGLFTTSRGILGYGVSDGAAGSISLRGMSGGSGRLMVLIDGHPQYMGLFGHPIADAYQSVMAERVEILRGPASVLYGSNAMGGVINIVTRKMDEDGSRTTLDAGYGSYNTLQTSLVNRTRKGGFSSIVSVSYDRTDGHRPNMDFSQLSNYVKLGYDFRKNWKIYGDVNLTHFNASNPGSISDPLEDADQGITRGMASVAVENDYGKTSGGLSFFYNWGKHNINDGYHPLSDDISENQPLDYRFHSTDYMMGISLYQSTAFFKGNMMTAGVDWYRFGGDAWNEYVAGNEKGNNVTIKGMPQTQHEVAGYLDFRQAFGTWLTLDAGLRADWHSQAGMQWIPQAGLAFHLPAAADLKVSASKGFRYPLIREMFMWGVANPELRPESMWNYEIGFSQGLLEGRVTYGVNVFYLDARNLIVAQQVDGRMMNVNTGVAKNAGAEVLAAWRISPSWSVDANYSFLHMENPIVASPEHKLYAGGRFMKGRWNISTGVQYIAGLYVSTGTNPLTEDFVLWNIRASFRAAEWLTIWAKGDNLLAQEYQINAGYPMPRATAMGGFTLEF